MRRAENGSAITLREGDPELEQEWGVAGTLAGIKAVLASANFFVIILDNSVPAKGDPASLNAALFAALLFWLYTVAALVTLRLRSIPIRTYEWLTPLLDIACSGLLILVTDGYASPFNTWLVLAVVATGFSADRRIPVVATVLAIAVHIGMSLIPQEIPLDPSLLAVRTTYLFGFAAMVVALGGTLARQARALGVVERIGAALGAAKTESEATDLLFTGLRRLLDSPKIEFRSEGDILRIEGARNGGANALHFEVKSGSLGVAEITIKRKRAFSDSERRWAELLCERYAACVRRLRLSVQLLNASARAERMRMADELHDGYLQTLTAVGFFLESIKMRRASNKPVSDEDLDEVCTLVRQATVQARNLLSPHDRDLVGGEEHIRAIFQERWTGEHTILFDPSADLSEGMWGVLEMMVKEGLNNARRHGRATIARLHIQRIGRQTLFVLETDGASPKDPVVFGYGLTSLKIKAEANRAQMYLAPSRSGGACLTIVFEGAPYD
jgi:signal transduction histidine kinase